MSGGLRAWIRGAASRFASNTGVNLAASFLADWFQGFGNPEAAISPQQLEQSAVKGEPLIRQAFTVLSKDQLYLMRAYFGRFAQTMGPAEYLRILETLEWDFPEHVAVLSRHLDWYGAQLDEARRWLLGIGNGSPKR